MGVEGTYPNEREEVIKFNRDDVAVSLFHALCACLTLKPFQP